jgi:hypothetical protein
MKAVKLLGRPRLPIGVGLMMELVEMRHRQTELAAKRRRQCRLAAV